MSEFGITPERLQVIAACWQSEGTEIGALAPAAELTGAEGSAGLCGLLVCARAAEESAAAAGRRLCALADGVQRFDALTLAADAAAAAAVRDGTGR